MNSSTSSSSPPRTLKVLTLNVWGLVKISKQRSLRIQAISQRLSGSDYDVIALQELFYESKDFQLLKESCKAKYPYSKYFYSGAFGSGLCFLSRFPIVDAYTLKYALNGDPVDVAKGDWFVGKSAGRITVKVKKLGLVDVWVTHTVAAGGEGGPPSNQAHRISQVYELSNMVREGARRGRHVICVGDFNSTPPSIPVSLLRTLGGLQDSFLFLNPQLRWDTISLPPPTSRRTDSDGFPNSNQETGSESTLDLASQARRSIRELGITCDSPLNTWTKGKPLDSKAKKGMGKRLDYIFWRNPEKKKKTSPHQEEEEEEEEEGNFQLKPTSTNVSFTELIPGLNESYSDHFGLETTFSIEKPLPSIIHSETQSLFQLESSPDLEETLGDSIMILSSGLVKSRRKQKNYLVAFSLALTLAVALIVLSILGNGRAWNGIYTLLAVVMGWAGTTTLYSGVIWSEWERRALRTIIESMEMELACLKNPTSSEGEEEEEEEEMSRGNRLNEGNLF